VAPGGPRPASGGGRVQRGSTRRAGRALPSKFQIDLGAGAVLTVASPGGGGFGRAARRRKKAIARVARDRSQREGLAPRS
jgi:N-methylhydantoinase B/oxoprolinase/acetone carboxylase alpha subunit